MRRRLILPILSLLLAVLFCPAADTKSSAELSIRLDNGKWELSIRAPDLKGVRDIYALAGLVLENMGQIPEQLKEETDDG